jgi:hypothetical protein
MKNEAAWTAFLNFYTAENAGRRTRLGVFELNRNVVNDYWLEDGLPLTAIVAEPGEGGHSIQIKVGDMRHEISGAIKLTCHFTSSGGEDGLDILDRSDRVTILRFEE